MKTPLADTITVSPDGNQSGKFIVGIVTVIVFWVLQTLQETELDSTCISIYTLSRFVICLSV
jgi:hypothetical protein